MTMGRPKKEINWDKLDAMCQYKPFLCDVAEYLEISEDTIERNIRAKHNCTCAEYRNKKMWRTRFNLTEKAVAMAMSGNTTMMIFCLKNLCGWADQVQESFEPEQPFPEVSI